MSIPVRIPRAEVVLRVWGATDEDRRRAEEDARNHRALYGRRIAEVEHADTPTPAAGDEKAIASGAWYDRTWAAYPVRDERREAA